MKPWMYMTIVVICLIALVFLFIWLLRITNQATANLAIQTLDDGTRCAVLLDVNGNALDCDWQP